MSVSTVTVRRMSELADRFRALHVPGTPLLIPNPWDAGSARVLASLGFAALATTSSGFAATLGRLDGTVSRDEAIGHGRQVAAAVEVPVSADLENGFADDPDGVAQTVRLAVSAGLAGCSIEDWSGTQPLRRRPRHGADRGRRGGCRRRARRHRAGRELPARPPRSRRHDRAPAAVRRGGGGRALRARCRRRRRARDARARGARAGQRARPPRRPGRRRAGRPRGGADLGRRGVRLRRARRARHGGPRTARAGQLRVLGALRRPAAVRRASRSASEKLRGEFFPTGPKVTSRTADGTSCEPTFPPRRRHCRDGPLQPGCTAGGRLR